MIILQSIYLHIAVSPVYTYALFSGITKTRVAGRGSRVRVKGQG